MLSNGIVVQIAIEYIQLGFYILSDKMKNLTK